MSNLDETVEDSLKKLESNLIKSVPKISELLFEVNKQLHDFEDALESLTIEFREFEAFLKNKGYVPNAKEKTKT